MPPRRSYPRRSSSGLDVYQQMFLVLAIPSVGAFMWFVLNGIANGFGF